MSVVSGKIWGLTKTLISNSSLELHYIEFKKGSSCSRHYHTSKYNAFICIRGKLKIEVDKEDYNLVDETILSSGDICIVPPGELHRFVGIEDGAAYELYWTELNPNDIIRYDVGSSNDAGSS